MQNLFSNLWSWLERKLRTDWPRAELKELAQVEERTKRGEFNDDLDAWRLETKQALQSVTGGPEYFETLLFKEVQRTENLRWYFEKQREQGEVVDVEDECERLERALRQSKDSVLETLFYGDADEFAKFESKRLALFPNYAQWYTVFAVMRLLRKLRNPADEVYACAGSRVRAFMLAYDLTQSLHINASVITEHLVWELANMLLEPWKQPTWQTGHFEYDFDRENNVFTWPVEVFNHMAQAVLSNADWSLYGKDLAHVEALIVEHLQLFVRVALEEKSEFPVALLYYAPETSAETDVGIEFPGASEKEANTIADMFEATAEKWTLRNFRNEFKRRLHHWF